MDDQMANDFDLMESNVPHPMEAILLRMQYLSDAIESYDSELSDLRTSVVEYVSNHGPFSCNTASVTQSKPYKSVSYEKSVVEATVATLRMLLGTYPALGPVVEELQLARREVERPGTVRIKYH